MTTPAVNTGAYADIASAALDILQELGQTITIERTVPGVPPSIPAGRPGKPTHVRAAAKGVVLPMQGRRYAADSFESQTLIENQNRTIYLAGNGLTYTVDGPGSFTGEFVPQVGDRVLGVEGQDWTVTGNSPTKPDGGNSIIHRMIIKLGQVR